MLLVLLGILNNSHFNLIDAEISNFEGPDPSPK